MSVLTWLIGLATSAVYLALLILAVRGAIRRREGFLWLAGTLASALLAVVVSLAPEAAGRAPVSVVLYSAALVMLGALTFAYLKRPGRQWWLLAGGGWLALLVGADLIGGQPVPGQWGWLGEAVSAGGLAGAMALAGWVLGGLALSALALRQLYTAHLPEVANRSLFWMVVILVALIGVILSASDSAWLTEVGWIVGLLGLSGATYAVHSHRIFDVRRSLLRGAGLAVATLATAIAFLAAALLARSLDLSGVNEFLALGALALVLAGLYVSLRGLAEVAARRYFSPATDPAPALRFYSQRITAVIELDEVVRLALQTVASALRARPGGLILVEAGEEGQVLVEPRRGDGLSRLPDVKGELDPQGPVYRTLFVAQAPLLQFDLEYDRAFLDAAPAERQFFQQLRMSAYAPIMVDGRAIGILASGPKVNDEAYQASDLEVLATVASQTGVALRNARLVDDLRRLNLELEEANAEFLHLDKVKTDFVTIASHELRTPLAQIRGYTDIMDMLNEQGLLDPAQMTGMTANLRKAAERMEELISDMLDVSKLDVDAMDLHFAPTALESVMRMAIEPLEEAIRSRKLSLSARGLRGLPTVEADMQRLVQAFRNVIVNAVRYTPDGGRIAIEAGLETRDGIPEAIHVTVSDTGIGIDPQHHELIFEKFYRVADPSLHSTGTTKFMGAGPGLGLTIARGMIEGHGGRIWVESPGYDPEALPGSTFHIVLPIHPPDYARRVMPFDETRLSITTEERAELAEAARQRRENEAAPATAGAPGAGDPAADPSPEAAPG